VDALTGETRALWDRAPETGRSYGNAVAFSPDGRWLACGESRGESGDGPGSFVSSVITIRRLSDGVVLAAFPDSDDSLIALTFAPQGSFLLSAHANALRRWDAALWKE
jgi:WD40 repeat protein